MFKSKNQDVEPPFIKWSCEGNYISFSYDPWLGISIVKTNNISSYLKNRKSFREVIIERKPESPASGYSLIGWKNDNEFDFTAACCGDINHIRHNIKSNKNIILWNGLYLKYKEVKRKLRN